MVNDNVRRPPWPKGDQAGMGNILGPETWLRCAEHLSDREAKCYELSHPISGTMPMSPFAKPLEFKSRATRAIPNTVHCGNMDEMIGEQGGQGTHIDSLGHFGYLAQPWDGTSEFVAGNARYYGGHTQADVKPEPDSRLQRLGVDNIPPIVTSALLLDARSHVGKGQALAPGQEVTSKHIQEMIEIQGLGKRGILPGDAIYIYTGWSDNWRDPDLERKYYTMGPGLSYDGAEFLAKNCIVLIALDNPFTDPVNQGQLEGKASAASSMPQGLPFGVHHFNLTQAGIYQIQNAKLDELARDRIWTSCTMVLPLRVRGGCGSLVRPVAIGKPH